MANTQRAILIGGTSHAGKSSTAAELAQILDGTHVSTDSLARHPGRPWSTPERTIPTHVPKYYREHTVDELIKDVLKHYRSVWPQVEELVIEHSKQAEPRLILEGSALLPELVAEAANLGADTCWLTASPELIEDRILKSSNFERARVQEKEPISRFVARAQAFNDHVISMVDRHGLRRFEVCDNLSISEIVSNILGNS